MVGLGGVCSMCVGFVWCYWFCYMLWFGLF